MAGEEHDHLSEVRRVLMTREQRDIIEALGPDDLVVAWDAAEFESTDSPGWEGWSRGDEPLTMTELMGQLDAEQHLSLARMRVRLVKKELREALRYTPRSQATDHLERALRILEELMPDAPS